MLILWRGEYAAVIVSRQVHFCFRIRQFDSLCFFLCRPDLRREVAAYAGAPFPGEAGDYRRWLDRWNKLNMEVD
jgi:hypothetical protein